ncbi:Glucosidase 2 subunit alpha [Cladophialophora carrionii]|uniref:alpha-glucosidase n=1 Tax=Cladophialophora carrionii TaxID=86049 RepID=A0A1C1CAY5_9EURO|nr:Glucosidase 2 subunit alpha [Cladophialophora carrionii]
MVKHHDFKRCDQSGFCKRNRALADTMLARGNSDSSPYQLDAASIKYKDGRLDASIIKSLSGGGAVKLPLTITFLDRGNVRIIIDEEKRKKGDIELRHGSAARKERYNEAGAWALTGAGLQPEKAAYMRRKGVTEVTWGPDGRFKAMIRHAPFGVEFWSGEEKQVVFNGQGFLNIEHWRSKVDKPPRDENSTDPEPTEPAEDESTWWEESFGGNTDSKPRGPESVALDISFPGYGHVYGLAEHAGPLSLKETRGGEGNYDQPYRMFNSDIFEYELDSPMTLYGSIPFMQAHKKDSTVGVFWLNAAETWVDITKSKHDTNPLTLGLTGGIVDTHTHWMSESGLLDVFVMLGSTPKDLSKSYSELTGYTAMPASFAIAYHQCRWNYVSDEDVKDVDRKFDKFNIPYDVIWLDIEYTNEKAYFTWDPLNFPDPISMEKQLDETERKLVVIIDPHIKNKEGYHVVEELKSKDLAVKNKDNNIFEGWCWPGSSSWLDSFNPAARSWWKSLFTYDRFKGTQSNVWLWNDMNEPSVFNGPEISMPRDNLHHGNWEHRDVHNLYGLAFHNATYHALLERKKGETPRRPFVLTRSFYAGSQRSAAMWTGDNQANWEHLVASIPMILNQGVSGFPFAGADIGGFFGNPSKELQTRWYQAGAFYPFMRGHAHIDTRRREPYMLGEPYTGIMTQALRLRYSLLPAWYNAFHEAATEGYPVVRSQYFVHPGDERGFAIDDQMYLGSSGLLVKPVTQEGGESIDVYIADDENYYDYFDYTVYSGRAGRTHTVSAPLDKIPLFMQGGHIVPRKDRPRKSSGLMKWDPYTLVVVLDKKGERAEGTLYVDDGETFDYQLGAYIHRNFSFENGELKSTDIGKKGAKTIAYLKTMKDVKVEKIIIVNAPAPWSSVGEVTVTEDGVRGSRQVELIYHAPTAGKAAWAVVRNPATPVGVDWNISFPEPSESAVKTEL